MWRDDLAEMADLNALSRQLDAAGRRAEAALARDPGRERQIVGRLRAQLLGDAPGVASADCDQRPIVLRPIVRMRLPNLRFSRSLAAGLAACAAVVGLVAVGVPLVLIRPAPVPAAVVDQAGSAVLMRDGSRLPLSAGMQLHQGDEVDVLGGGTASLSVGGSHIRLQSGAALRLDRLSADRIGIDQTAGRVFYRLVVSGQQRYEVATDAVDWEAASSAFDLDRIVTAGGAEEVRGLALESSVDASGPGLSATIPEGTGATIQLVPGSAGSVIEPIGSSFLADAWLEANAREDARLGLPLGWLVSLADETPPPTFEPNPTDTALPSWTPTAPPTPAASPTIQQTPPSTPATPRPTVAPTPRPTGTPTPVDMGPLQVVKNGDETYTVSWNAYSGPLSIYAYALCYTTNENASFGYVEHFGGAISVPRTSTSWTGTFPWPATLKVKVEAIFIPPAGTAQKAGETQVVVVPYTGETPTPSPSPTASPTPTPPPVVNLGDFVTAQNNGDGTYTFTWNAYTGPLSVAYLISGTTTASGSFGYFENGQYWSDPNTLDLTWTGPITSGSWRIKVEAISTSTGQVIKAAETNIYFLTIP